MLELERSLSFVENKRRLWLCVLLAGTFSAPLSGQETNDREAWVKAQILLLDADTLRERSAAEQRLVEAGPVVLPFLPPPEQLPNVAVRQAVRRIRLLLEQDKARQSVKPSRVTLDQTASLESTLKSITKQTENRLDASLLPRAVRERSVSIQVSDQPFWEVMQQLSRQAEFSLEGQADQSQPDEIASALVLTPIASEEPPRPAVNVGAFRVSTEALSLRPRFGEENQQLLRVPFRVSAEPRLRPLFLKLAGKDFLARTPEGKELPPFNPEALLELPLGEGGTATRFPVDFQVPKPFAKPSVHLTGKATLTVAADEEEFVFTGLEKAEGAARRRGGVSVRLSEIEFRPDPKTPDHQTARFRITVHYDTGGPAFESHRTWIFHNRVYLKTATGQRLARNSDFHTALQTDGGVIVEYNFEHLTGGPKDYSFTYVAPTLIINVPIQFEFPALPIPEKP